MKKILFGILTFLGVLFSFCSAGEYTVTGTYINNNKSLYAGTSFCGIQSHFYTNSTFDYSCSFSNFSGTLNNSNSVSFALYYNYPDGSIESLLVHKNLSSDMFVNNGGFSGSYNNGYYDPIYFAFRLGVSNNTLFSFDYSCTFSGVGISDSSSSSCEDKNIIVFYNSGNTESILCDGTQAIEIKGLSTLTSTNTFTPYFNISYKDQDNQSLVESYSKDILYLENGLFKKTYTGNNDWILSVQGGSLSSFSGYLPTFEITGGINEPTESGNIFNNFAENSVKFAFSNIPSYIQYVLMFALLMLILGLVKPFKRKR